ncbi:inorganic diphosphatase [Humibacillus xanthopallidus]|uniref:inorganic diphosphatase n=1 Tax=Humibacillus xanthopallidus TaxID=412689 RepID=A0A543HZ98_9MICO|nr:inorganic diphosphatase [Humibacillus xanthopallidus]TQM63684.1 inorganic pyrophosphatase [Humibacillus xanthopallidus]
MKAVMIVPVGVALLMSLGSAQSQALTGDFDGHQHNGRSWTTGPNNFISGWTPGPNEDGSYNMFVEIPANTNEKWETCTDKAVLDAVAFPECVGTVPGERMVWEVRDGSRRVVSFLNYPGNYGTMPQTKSGDGDPLDMMTLGETHYRTAPVSVKVIGVLRCLDKGDVDDKIIGLQTDHPLYASVNDLTASEPTNLPVMAQILEQWWENNKKLNAISCTVEGPASATTIIGDAHAAYLAE